MARPLRQRRQLALLLASGLLACQQANEFAGIGPRPCTITAPPRDLPHDVWETSGLALSRRIPGVIWTHNDSGNEPVLYALDSAGAIIARVRVTGAELIDWEDIAAGPCDTGTCLYIGDIGDNSARRDSISIYVVPEPSLSDTVTLPATVLYARYPTRPQDAEALFVLPPGDIYVITKGRRDSIAVYRYPKTVQHPGGTTWLEQVRTLGPKPHSGMDRVTGASATSDYRWVAIRTYRSLLLYSTTGLLADSAPKLTADLGSLHEFQGEGVAVSDSGTVWLSTEGEDEAPRFSRLTCPLVPAG